MTHLHFPDGILPIWLVMLGFLFTGTILSISLNKLKQEEYFAKKASLIAMMSALMLIVMSIPLGFIHYHINLTVLVSLLIGPWFAAISVFVVNLFLGLFGHGGITVVGLNSLVLISEVFIAAWLFSQLKRYLPNSLSLFSTVYLTIIISTGIMFGVVLLSTFSTELMVLAQHLEEGHEMTSNLNQWFFSIIMPIVLLGAALEASLITFIVKYLYKVRPELVKHLISEELQQQETV
ncbi:MAG: energy-coupling factor ABC transporter permease [Bacillota bacterium]|nr:energy-coupling factor ABC transporter permease [Bacillota bacterium]